MGHGSNLRCLYQRQQNCRACRYSCLRRDIMNYIPEKIIDREEIDGFRTVVKDGKYDFGVFVGVIDEKISVGAYLSAERRTIQEGQSSKEEVINLQQARHITLISFPPGRMTETKKMDGNCPMDI